MIVVLKPFNDISEIFGFFWQFQMANVGVYFENADGNIDFFTFFPKSDNFTEVINQPNANVGLLFGNGTAYGALSELLTRRKFLSFF